MRYLLVIASVLISSAFASAQSTNDKINSLPSLGAPALNTENSHPAEPATKTESGLANQSSVGIPNPPAVIVPEPIRPVLIYNEALGLSIPTMPATEEKASKPK